ncbi:metal ABC transporter solute-binding protein, Zn/Mn family [Maridesulfovibrio salexigens]|uniref:Periplasmic solute binding protein n=1 Tax=Maridesulfovibrio salexigens (strain ATCC 14822 / DSM 2638 / NCIMB 8403 / VKM B-1763) TaxID=526222 RepID=C6BSN1_MARSD|nr:zinc ABC transporter substrate-binding protein [Maridesulfovibrio salexigens]ACS81487.1 periplasmic solute binding protein [Maridesulfovibrio salexigens DSM 2638]
MKISKTIILTVISLLLNYSVAAAEQFQTTVSIAPLKYFVEKIGGENVKTNIMVKAGSSPATYEPQPKQMADLSKSEIYFAIGVPFEQAWLPRFKSANSNLEIVNLGEAVIHRSMKAHIHEDEGEHGHTHHDDHGEAKVKDPHVWLAPPLVRVISQKILETLIEHDPENAATYTSNYLSFAAEINDIDSELLKTFTQKGQKFSFMVYHPSWGYFADTYALNQIPIELEGKEPSPKKMAQLIEFAKTNSVKAIFIQPQFSQKSAQTIANAIDAKVLIADPLAEDWTANLRRTAKAFATQH